MKIIAIATSDNAIHNLHLMYSNYLPDPEPNLLLDVLHDEQTDKANIFGDTKIIFWFMCL